MSIERAIKMLEDFLYEHDKARQINEIIAELQKPKTKPAGVYVEPGDVVKHISRGLICITKEQSNQITSHSSTFLSRPF